MDHKQEQPITSSTQLSVLTPCQWSVRVPSSLGASHLDLLSLFSNLPVTFLPEILVCLLTQRLRVMSSQRTKLWLLACKQQVYCLKALSKYLQYYTERLNSKEKEPENVENENLLICQGILFCTFNFSHALRWLFYLVLTGGFGTNTCGFLHLPCLHRSLMCFVFFSVPLPLFSLEVWHLD